MSSSVTQLAELFSPPPTTRSLSWHGVEARLGAQVPDDYKALVGVFGDAVFCDSVELYQAEEDSEMNLAAATIRDRDFLTDSSANDRPTTTPDGQPFDTAKLISWGKDPGGGYWLWYPDPSELSDPLRYRVVYSTADQVFWDFFEGTTSDVLYRFVTGAEPPPDAPGNVREIIGGGPPYVDIYVDGQPTRFSSVAG